MAKAVTISLWKSMPQGTHYSLNMKCLPQAYSGDCIASWYIFGKWLAPEHSDLAPYGVIIWWHYLKVVNSKRWGLVEKVGPGDIPRMHLVPSVCFSLPPAHWDGECWPSIPFCCGAVNSPKATVTQPQTVIFETVSQNKPFLLLS